MKRLLFSGALCAGWALSAHAQGVTTWVEQLAVLRALEQTVKQGYTVVTHGLQTIGDLRSDEYNLHQAYYGSFETVSPIVASDPKTLELTNLLEQLIQRLNAELDCWRQQTPINQL